MEQVIRRLGNQGALSLLTPMESNFDSNLWTLSRGILPTVKYQRSLSMISMVASKDNFHGQYQAIILYFTGDCPG